MTDHPLSPALSADCVSVASQPRLLWQACLEVTVTACRVQLVVTGLEGLKGSSY